MTLNPAPNLGINRMKIYCSVAKLTYFFHFVEVWYGPSSTAHTMTSYSKNNYDGLPTTFIATRYMIKVTGNQIASAHLHYSSSSNTVPPSKYSTVAQCAEQKKTGVRLMKSGASAAKNGLWHHIQIPLLEVTSNLDFFYLTNYYIALNELN